MQALRQWSVRHAFAFKRAYDACACLGPHLRALLRLRRIGGADIQKLEAKTVLVETMRAVSQIDGVAGVHLMGYRNDDILAEAIAESGIRRSVSMRAA